MNNESKEQFKVGERVSGLMILSRTKHSGKIIEVFSRVHGGARVEHPDNQCGAILDSSTLRHEPAEEQKAWEPKCGERVLGRPHYADAHSPPLAGTVLRLTCDSGDADYVILELDTQPAGWCGGANRHACQKDSLRPLPASTPPARAHSAKGYCPPCNQSACAQPHLHIAEQPKPSEPARGDPYKCARCQTPKCSEAQFDGAIGLCGMCVADVLSADERPTSTADDVAWCLRVRRHHEEAERERKLDERRRAYISDSTKLNTRHEPPGNFTSDLDQRITESRERRKSEALRMLDRPLPVRTGPLADRDQYGQRLALHGWDSDDV